MSRISGREGRRGQTLVLFAGGIIAFIGMVGLVIDGGNAFAQQRRSQNGADASAEAGATQLARKALGVPPTANDATWDQRVLDAVNATAAANDLTIVGASQYTDVSGVVLGPVGTGTIPANSAGVQVNGNRNFRTYVAGAIGLTNFTASAGATAVTGYLKSISRGNLLPVTFPILLTQCDTGGGSNRLENPTYGSPPTHEWPYGPNNMVALPFCSNGPGNVGWIDWTPTAGGASELSGQIITPSGPAVTTPKWYYITATGTVSSADAAMDTWEGRDIEIPIFDVVPDDPATPVDESLLGTCDTTPTGTQTALTDCPPGHNGGSGSNQWYYLVTFGDFHLVHSYIQGMHQAECNAPPPALVSTATFNAGSITGGALIDNCLIGYFNSGVIAGPGEVTGTPTDPRFTQRGVQLIK